MSGDRTPSWYLNMLLSMQRCGKSGAAKIGFIVKSILAAR
jgi:hypothetical protein